MIKAAVVGVNHIGRVHCQTYRENKDVEFVAICDLDQALADSVAKEFGVHAYTDVELMIEKEEIDVVSIATGGVENGSHHFEPAMLALKAGKDVLVEKPISNRLDEARKLVDLAKQQNVRLGCDLNHRFVPTAYKAKEWIQEGALGALLFINMKLTIGNPNESSPWLHLRALHPHSIDVMRYFCGDVKRVQAFMTKAPGRTVWSTASINLEFASGAVGHLMGSYDMSNHHPIEYCEVAGNKGRFVIDNVYEQVTLYPHHTPELKVIRNAILTGMGEFNDTLKNRINFFVQQIKEKVMPENIEGSGQDALAAQEVIEAAIRSHEEGGAVIEVGQKLQEH
ncbi:putative dehydrogenase [Pullulanibacillus pueri]|uniref:Oxidoreductase n=1 Tax=Pullulanibacillus pueri TaxID=1437324 RepID=A0A8J2ZT11_9BACL|nr:Gfo/Idh/MocA family oxidoreductase [Pullulanibacillus pueri]MBM7680288.1 putative dehydrogenase [Pullulanibacillus pueri]GGH75825.1 oxidoreductase [Pullulanibacillus pueri]